MSRQTRRSLLASVALLAGGAGCLDALQSGVDPSGGGTPTPLPDRTVTLPDGPKAPPERPTSLTLETVREFALLYEYRYVYNELWRDEDSTVSLSCRVVDAASFEHGYRVTVGCSGQAETDGDGGTPVRDEWPDRVVTYLVDEDAVIRE